MGAGVVAWTLMSSESSSLSESCQQRLLKLGPFKVSKVPFESVKWLQHGCLFKISPASAPAASSIDPKFDEALSSSKLFPLKCFLCAK